MISGHVVTTHHEATHGYASRVGTRPDKARQGFMRIATAHLESIAPYSQSRYYERDVQPGGRGSGTRTESAKDYEARTWRERVHVNGGGHVLIPPMAFKNCIAEIAKYLGVQIPGKGKSTYTKHFEAGVMVLEGLSLPETKDTVEGEWLFVPASGRRGDGKRVSKCFPVIRQWTGVVTFHVLDDVITEDIFDQHLRDAGNFIGIGRFRPRNNGYYGRFKVNKVVWS